MRFRSFLAVLGILSGLLKPALGGGYQSEETGETQQNEQAVEGLTSEPALFLEGVIVTSDPERSVALVRRPGAGYARAVTVGETIYGFELLNVSEDAITVREGEEVLRLTLSGEWHPVPPSSLSDSLPQREAGSSGSVRTLERSSVEKRLSEEMPRILAQTGLTPRVLEGQVKGFRITRLPRGTVLDDTGIRAGDVLLSINEIFLNSPYTLIDLYPRLQMENEIRVVLERAGQTVTYVYNFN